MRTRWALVVFACATLWAAAIAAAPRLVDRRLFLREGFAPTAIEPPRTVVEVSGALVYLTGSYMCHQRPERSFHDGSVPYPVCARCTGLYVAAPVGILAMLAVSRLSRGSRAASARHASTRTNGVSGGRDPYRRWRLILSLTAVPTVVSIVLEWAGGPSDVTSRALAALPLGAALAACVAAAMLGHFALDGRRVPEPRAGV